MKQDAGKSKKAYVLDTEEEIAHQANEAAVAIPIAKSFQFYLGSGGSYKKITDDKFDFIQLIRKGVSRKSLDHLMSITGITSQEMSGILHTSDRTLRRYTGEKVLNTEQSEKVLQLAKLYSRGEDVFGSLESFKDWVDSNIIALGNRKPKEFFDTSMGIDLIMEELGRIEQGIFA